MLDAIRDSAMGAWSQVAGGRSRPSKAEHLLIRGKRKSTLFRLDGVGLEGASVIAKRGFTRTAEIERRIYEEVLPELPVTYPYYYGFAREDDQFSWLFLEDIGTEQFSPSDEKHRCLGARWLGLLHSTARKSRTADSLPSRGAEHYLQHLRSGRTTILSNRGNPALGKNDWLILGDLISQLDSVESCWSQLQAFCDSMPRTLVHGDFQPKNVFVRETSDELELFPIDWEVCGWGIPAPDLEPPPGRISCSQVDIPTYLATVGDHWLGLDTQTVHKIVPLGAVLRTIAAVDWSTTFLAHGNVGRTIARMDGYRVRLTEAVCTLRQMNVID